MKSNVTVGEALKTDTKSSTDDTECTSTIASSADSTATEDSSSATKTVISRDKLVF